MALRRAGRGEGHRHSGGGDYAYDQYTMPAPEAGSSLMRTPPRHSPARLGSRSRRDALHRGAGSADSGGGARRLG